MYMLFNHTHTLSSLWVPRPLGTGPASEEKHTFDKRGGPPLTGEGNIPPLVGFWAGDGLQLLYLRCSLSSLALLGGKQMEIQSQMKYLLMLECLGG